MDDCEFIQEKENESRTVLSNVLTGWESIVFQVEDVPPDD
jgi:hypothetical protein